MVILFVEYKQQGSCVKFSSSFQFESNI